MTTRQRLHLPSIGFFHLVFFSPSTLKAVAFRPDTAFPLAISNRSENAAQSAALAFSLGLYREFEVQCVRSTSA
jgi:hypothetical protein